jgi:PilZ domain
MALAIERRTSPRTTPGALGDDLLILDLKHEAMMHARLLDISAGGALLHFDGVIANSRSFSILVHNVPELGWIEAEVVRSVGPREVGVRFISPFSPEFVQAATSECSPRRGHDAEGATPYLGNAIPIW